MAERKRVYRKDIMKKQFTKREWEKRRKRDRRIKKGIRLSIVTLIGAAVLTLLCFSIGKIYTVFRPIPAVEAEKFLKTKRPEIVEAFLTPNEYSRPGIPLNRVNGVVVHYTANPGSTGWQNRNYFENLKDTKKTKVSSHFIIGIDGTIIQCIPLDEISYASNERNGDTISIECCHLEKNGEFTEETYDSLVKLTAWLAGEYNLTEDDILRHYDITGKKCPKDFVVHEEKWEQFKIDVKQ